MRVTNKMIYSNFTYNLMHSEEIIQKRTNQISTGRRIELPSDDPIGTTRAMAFRTRLTEMNQYIDNSERAISWLNCTDDALMTLNTNLQRVNELVVAGANGSLTVQAREALAEEIDQIMEGIMQVANTSIDNRYVFAGEKMLEPPYQKRPNVSGNSRNLEVNPIQIDLRNNQFQIKVDFKPPVTVTLTPRTYDGSPGRTLDDLADDIQTQLQQMGLEIPVHVRVNGDNKVIFYAGKQPPEGVNTVVLKEGPAIKEVGFVPSVGAVGFNILQLDANANNNLNYYSGWKLTITDGPGAGQTRTVTGYDESTQVATVDSNWQTVPGPNSKYILTPPFEGISTASGANTIQLNTNAASGVDDFYVGMEITVTGSNGQSERRTITDYDAASRTITVGGPAWTIPPQTDYTITPHLEGAVESYNDGPPPRLELNNTSASIFNDFYSGASVTVTYDDGSTETRKITNYDAATFEVETTGGNWRSTPVSYKISDTSLAQLGFENKATTKELVGSPLPDEIKVMGKYPEVGIAAGGAGNQINFTNWVGTSANYYNNWTITIKDGTGEGQTRQITGFAGGVATVVPAWDTIPGTDSVYELNPPLVGDVPATVGLNQIRLADNSSAIPDFYKGMPITIIDGTGKSQTRTILSYTAGPPNIATVDSDWSTPPGTDSKYSIDAHYYVNANNKFKIKVGNNLTQEISLAGGTYTRETFAKMVEEKINERGGPYADVKVYLTSDNQLRMVPQDPDLNSKDTPLPIVLESGSEADALKLLGFQSGVYSEQGVYNFEGNTAEIEYEVNAGVKIQVNYNGAHLFDKIFEHLAKITTDLRADNTVALSGDDLKNIQDDIDAVLIAQGEIGAKVNRLEKSVDRIEALNENVTKLLSHVEDTDITKAITELTMQETAYQAALQSGARIMTMTLLDFLK